MPVLSVLAAAALWGLVGPVSRFALRDGLSGLEIAFWRAALAAVVFSLQAGFSGGRLPSRRDLPGLVLLGLTGVAGLEATNLLAVETGGANLASILLYSAPAWVAIASRIFFGERLGRRKAVALAVCLLGVFGVAWSGPADGRGFSAVAVGWGLASGLSYASFYILGRTYLSRYDSRIVLGVAFPIGAAAILPLVDFHAKSAVSWWALLFLAGPSTFLAYTFYSYGLRRIEPTRAAILATLEPVVAAFAAYLLWGEVLDGRGYAFAGCVLAGVAWMARSSSKAVSVAVQPGEGAVSSSPRS